MLIAFLKSYFLTKYRSFTTREQLEKWQNKRIISHLQWVTKFSPFYRRIYRGLDINNWREFPLISKKEMMECFNELNTCQINKEEAFSIAMEAEKKQSSSSINEITIGLSSGTSGSRGLFLVSPLERFSWAGAMLAKTLSKGLLSHQKIAFFFRTTSALYNSIKSLTIQLEYYNLKNPVKELVNKLNFQQPHMLVAPPSMLRTLASESKMGNLNIAPQKIISVAEILDPIDEKFISNIFEQKIHQIYQATEGFLATTCQFGTLHLNEDLIIIQKEKIPGQEGKFYPVITDFNRFSQPIIRYRLNDILHEYEGQCPCGSLYTAIKFIEGRSDDIFYFKSKDKLKPIFPDFIREALITAHSEIEEYLVHQISPLSLNIALKISKEHEATAFENVRNNIIKLTEKNFVKTPEITYVPYVFGNQNPEKKLCRIQRKFQVCETIETI